MNLLRLQPQHSLRLLRHRRTNLLRRHTRLFRIAPTLTLSASSVIIPLLPIPLRQRLLVTRHVFPLSGREGPHLADAHEDGYGARFEDLADGAAAAAFGRRAAEFVEDGFQDGEAGVYDAEEDFHGGEEGDEGVDVLGVGAGDGGCDVDAPDCDGADAVSFGGD